MPWLTPSASLSISHSLSLALISLDPQKAPPPQACLLILTMTTIPSGLAQHSAIPGLPQNLPVSRGIYPRTHPHEQVPTLACC